MTDEDSFWVIIKDITHKSEIPHHQTNTESTKGEEVKVQLEKEESASNIPTPRNTTIPLETIEEQENGTRKKKIAQHREPFLDVPLSLA